MKLTWIGHSCFKVEKDGYRIVIDPYQDDSVPGLAPVREEAELVLCTHEHGDHNGRECVTVSESAESPFRITELETFHDDAKGQLRGVTRMYILDDGEQKIAHLGDIGCPLTEEQIRALSGLDVLLLPVGGYYTIDAKEAVGVAELLKPRVVIPMHFRDEEAGFGYEVIGTVKAFTDRMEGSVTVLHGSTLETEELKPGTIVLEPLNRKTK